MGIWRSIFGWKALFRWDVLGAIVPGIFIAVAFGMLSLDWFPHNLLIAQVCLASAGTLCVVKTIGHSIEHEGSKANRALFALVLSVAIIGIDAYTLRVIETRKEPRTPSQASSSVSSTTPATPQSRSPVAIDKKDGHTVPEYNLDNVTEAIWFGFHGSSIGLASQFQEVDQSSLGIPSGASSINTVDNLSPGTYERAWASTFGQILLCDPANGVIGSGLSVTLSEHPTIEVQIANSSVNGSSCRLTANLINAIHGYIPVSNAGHNLGYILDLPLKGNAFGRDAFGFRIYLTGEAIKDFAQGDLPRWRSFAIDDPNQSIQLELTRKGNE